MTKVVIQPALGNSITIKLRIDAILALPNTKLIKGKPYVIVTHCRPNGKQVEKTRRVDSVDEAIEAIADIKREFKGRGHSAYEGEKMTFVELLDEYEKTKELKQWYRTPIEEYFGKNENSIDHIRRHPKI